MTDIYEFSNLYDLARKENIIPPEIDVTKKDSEILEDLFNCPMAQSPCGKTVILIKSTSFQGRSYTEAFEGAMNYLIKRRSDYQTLEDLKKKHSQSVFGATRFH